ncbi:382_t:CDS:2, partial [Racocetra fulgida]
PKKLKQKQESVCRVQDEGHIFRDTYSNLVAIKSHLPRIWTIYERRKQITQDMAKPDITEVDIIENVIHLVEKCGYRSVIDILKFIMPKLIEKKFLIFQILVLEFLGMDVI